MVYPSFKVFKKRIYDKLNEAERNRLFYWSLFDPSGWEETESIGGGLPAYLPSMPRRKQSILSILRRDARIKKNFLEKYGDEFFRRFANGEVLTNYLLAAALLDYLRAKKISGYQPVNLEQQIFPDVHLQKDPRKNVYLEVKGIIGASNLFDRVKIEVQPNLNKGRRKYSNFCLILIFPCDKNEAKRIHQIIQGYYVYEVLIRRSTKNARRVLCCCIRRQNNTDGFSLSKLVERIANLNYF